MKIMTWNCRVVASSIIFRTISDTTKEYKPDVSVLLEPPMVSSKVRCILHRFHFTKIAVIRSKDLWVKYGTFEIVIE